MFFSMVTHAGSHVQTVLLGITKSLSHCSKCLVKRFLCFNDLSFWENLSCHCQQWIIIQWTEFTWVCIASVSELHEIS